MVIYNYRGITHRRYGMLREKVEREIDTSFKVIINFLYNNDEKMATYAIDSFRAKVEFANAIGLITLDEWFFLNRACALI